MKKYNTYFYSVTLILAIFYCLIFSQSVEAKCDIKYKKNKDTTVCKTGRLRTKIWDLNTNLYTIYWQYGTQSKLSSNELFFDYDFYPATPGKYYVKFAITDLNNSGCIKTDSILVIYNPTNSGVANFTGLKSTYCIASFPEKLTESPTGGLFSGPGVFQNTNGWFFSPDLAGPGTHTICYRLGCLTPACKTVTVNNAPCVTDITPKLPDLSSAVKVPQGVTTACDGTIYFSDSQKNVIWQVDATGAKIIIGDSTQSGNRLGPAAGSSATKALVNFPTGLVIVDGILYFCDAGNHAVKRYYHNGIQYVVELVAGANSSTGSGDLLGPALAAQFNSPFGIALDRAKRYLYIADSYNFKVKKIDLSAATRDVSLVSQHGTWRTFHIALDNTFCYVALPNGFRVSKVNLSTGVISDFFRDTNNPKTPYGVSVGCGGDVYVAETTEGKIFKITQAGAVSEVVGLSNPIGLSVYTKGYIDVVESFPSGGKISRIAISNWKEGAFSGLNKTEFCLNDASVSIKPTTCSDPGSTMYGPGVSGSGGNYTFSPSAAGIGTHYITYKYSAGFCTDSLTAVVNVYPLPEITITPDDFQFCTKDTIVLTATVNFPSLADTLYWKYGGVQIAKTVGSTTSIKVTRGGTYTVDTKNYKNCVATTTIDLDDNRPNINLTKTQTICSGDSIQLNPQITGPGSNLDYSFVWTPATGLSNANVRSPYAKPIVPTKYFVRATHMVTGCQRRDSVQINISPKPAKPNLSSNSISACPGDSINLGGAPIAGNTYKWTFIKEPISGGITLNRDDVSAIKGKLSWAINDNNDYKIKVTNKDAAGCSNSDTVTITPKSKPLSNAAGPDKVTCQGSPVQIGSVYGYSYTWTPSTGLSSATAPNPMANPATSGDHIYYLKVTGVAAGACSNYDTVKVTVNPGPISNPKVTRAICGGTSITIGAPSTNSGTYDWTPTTGLASPNSPQTSANPTSTQQYIRTNIFNGCTSKDTVIVNVSSKPTVTISPNPAKICTSDSLTITASVGVTIPSDTIKWKTSPTGSILKKTIGSTSTYKVGTAGSISLEIKNAYGCGQDTTISITNGRPSFSIPNRDTTICAADSFRVRVNTPVGGATPHTYVWTPSSGIRDTTVLRPYLKPIINTTYKLRVVTADGCFREDTIRVRVNPNPKPAVVTASLCAGSSISIGGAAVPGATNYTWTPVQNPQPALVTLSSTSIANPSLSAAGSADANTYSYRVSIRQNNGCIATNTSTITVLQNKINAGGPKQICAKDSVQIGPATILAGGTYSWTPTTGLSNANIAQPKASPSATTQYIVTFSSGGCTAKDTV